ncbi:MAG: hypothetical protein KDD61_04265 [Bdellovibrionales bacterium]|nr:hypothetical protein [Bdellovibrionales bacterium]
MFKLLVILFLGLLGSSELCWAREPTVDIFSQYDSQLYFSGSFNRGGASFGAAYEYNQKKLIGFGVYFHHYAEDIAKGATGASILGAFFSPHIDHGDWDCYFMTGLAVIKIDKNVSTESGFGPSFAVGVLYHIMDGIAFGIEKLDHFDWATSHDKGPIVSDLVAKIRVSF